MESFVPLFEDFAVAQDRPAYVSYTIMKGDGGGIDGVAVNKWQADGRKFLSHTSEQDEDAAQEEVMEIGDGTWHEALRVLDSMHGDDLWVENEPAIERIKSMLKMRLKWRRMKGDCVTRIYGLDGGAQDDAIFGGGREWNMERGPWTYDMSDGRRLVVSRVSDGGDVGYALSVEGERVRIDDVAGLLSREDMNDVRDLIRRGSL